MLRDIAKAQATIFKMLQLRWIVAHNGTTKSATSASTPFLITCAWVTGMVAAELWVPRAVMYAGIIFQSILNGFFPATAPAMQNCIISTDTCIAKMTSIILMNIPRTGATFPSAPIWRKIPKMNIGSSGMMKLQRSRLVLSTVQLKVTFLIMMM